MQRWILHLDMDAFFASIEQLDFPELRGKPIAVGSQDRGVVAAASYEARKFGVHSAMPSFKAKSLCPHLIFVKGRRARYVEKSKEIMRILRDFSPLVEPASIDEAYLDLTGLEKIFGSIPELAKTIQRTVSEQSLLTCSVGLAPVKFLAKIASDLNKPNGVSIILPEEVPHFVSQLPVEKIPGVGKKTVSTLHALGVRTAEDVKKYAPEFWQRKLGKGGESLYQKAFGIDNREVEPYSEPKSESAENTFSKDIQDIGELSVWIYRQSERVAANLRKMSLAGKTITVKIKFSDFSQITRSHTLSKGTNTTEKIYAVALHLLKEASIAQPLRLIGVGVSNFREEAEQLSLFTTPEAEENKRDVSLDTTLDQLRDKFGDNAIIRGRLFKKENE